MLKSTAVVLALCAQLVFSHTVRLTNSAGIQVERHAAAGRRICACLKNTETKTIKGVNAGHVRLYGGRTDCTGNFSTMGNNGTVSNAYWVYSISFGANVSSFEHYYGCPPPDIIPFAAADNGQSDAVQITDV